MRAELRNWYYNSDKCQWEGYVFDDADEVLYDGTFVTIHARNLKEVTNFTDVTFFEFKNGTRWFAMNLSKKEDK
jgi:hypothetical protein